MSVLYHCTDRVNLPYILRDGLEPRDTSMWNYPGFDTNAGVCAVYMTRQRWGWSASDEYSVCIEIDVDGLEIEPDPAIPPTDPLGAFRTREPIAPDRFRCVHETMEEEDRAWWTERWSGYW